ncbi:MAG: hypothetical protein V5A62_05285 [Haloarculaceae archaeon]
MLSIADVVPFRGLPNRSCQLLVGHELAVAALVVLTVATTSYGSSRWFDGAYRGVVLPAIAFGLPVAVGVASAALEGFLVGLAGRLAW